MIALISILLKILGLVIPLLISVAYLTIAERKLLGSIQRRKGPNVVGFLGLLQPFADDYCFPNPFSRIFICRCVPLCSCPSS